MNARILFLALAESPNVLNDEPSVNIYSRDFFMVCGAVGGVAVLLILWAIFLRKPPRRRHRLYHHRHHEHEHEREHEAGTRRLESSDETDDEELENDADAAEEEGSGRHRHRHRRRRRQHRPRNPTLAETGGLPPIRPDKPTGMSSP